jgi:hypothetical protein
MSRRRTILIAAVFALVAAGVAPAREASAQPGSDRVRAAVAARAAHAAAVEQREIVRRALDLRRTRPERESEPATPSSTDPAEPTTRRRP